MIGHLAQYVVLDLAESANMQGKDARHPHYGEAIKLGNERARQPSLQIVSDFGDFVGW
jgi:hypothetical protein